MKTFLQFLVMGVILAVALSTAIIISIDKQEQMETINNVEYTQVENVKP